MNKIITVLSSVLYRLEIFSIIRWLHRGRPTIISYHSPKPEVVDAHFKYLSKIYHFISIDEYYNILTGGGKFQKYSLLVTFDDGHKSNIALLPIFIKYNVKPVIYLVSHVVGTLHPFWWKMVESEKREGYKTSSNDERLKELKEIANYDPDMMLPEPMGLTSEDIVMLKGHVTFGSHTRTHPILTKCTDKEQEDEIVNSKIELETLCGEPIRHFAYPNGDYNQTSIFLCKKAGYVTARTIHTGWNGKNTDPFQLKLVGISDDADIDKFRFQLSGIYPWLLYIVQYGSLNGRKRIL